MLYYALVWGVKPHIPAGAEPFTLHKRSAFGDMVLCLGLAALLEILPLHLLLHRWSPIAAWTLTALSLYGAIWLAGLFRSLERRPGYVLPGEATIRLGLFLTLRIPADCVRQVGTEPGKADSPGSAWLDAESANRIHPAIGRGTVVRVPQAGDFGGDCGRRPGWAYRGAAPDGILK